MSSSSLPQMIRAGQYSRSWLKTDLIAGLTVGAMLVPQAMAYADLGDLPPSAGFRAALLAIPVYALLGTSRHLGVGPEPGTAILAALTVAPLAAGDESTYLALMAALAGLVGIISIAGGLLRLGFVSNLLSKPVLVGYITGVGLTLLSSQYGKFFGISIESDTFLPRTFELAREAGDVSASAALIGLGTLIPILLARRYQPAFPAALFALAGSTVLVATTPLDVSSIGEIQASFPTFGVPDVSTSQVRALLPGAAGLVLVGYTDNILTARSIAASRKYQIDPNRELVALGAMNAAGAFGGGFPMSSSASRSIVPATLGSRSQASSLFTFAFVVGVLLVGRTVLAEIPVPALAAVIVAASFAVIELPEFGRLSRVDTVEMLLAVATTVAVITTDLLYGILFAVVLSAILTLSRVARPHTAVLGAGKGVDGWIDIADDQATTMPGLLVYRFDAPLFFANATFFRDRLFLLLEQNPGEEREVILDFEGIGSVDTTAVDRLCELHEELTLSGIGVSIARPNASVVDTLARGGVIELLGEDRLFSTINGAVASVETDTET